jgi:hypothetical protein
MTALDVLSLIEQVPGRAARHVPRPARDQRDGAEDRTVVQPDHELTGTGFVATVGDACER